MEYAEVFGIVPESPEHVRVLWELRKEVEALLLNLHPNIVQLIGVVVDALRRPVKLLFELAQFGDLERCVRVRVCARARTRTQMSMGVVLRAQVLA